MIANRRYLARVKERREERENCLRFYEMLRMQEAIDPGRVPWGVYLWRGMGDGKTAYVPSPEEAHLIGELNNFAGDYLSSASGFRSDAEKFEPLDPTDDDPSKVLVRSSMTDRACEAFKRAMDGED